MIIEEILSQLIELQIPFSTSYIPETEIALLGLPPDARIYLHKVDEDWWLTFTTKELTPTSMNLYHKVDMKEAFKCLFVRKFNYADTTIPEFYQIEDFTLEWQDIWERLGFIKLTKQFIRK